MPAFLYGTAWKEDRTEELTRAALEAGFRGIDTANQRRHYVEAAAGNAVKSLSAEGRLNRSAVFLQTKFTHRAGVARRLRHDAATCPETPFGRKPFTSAVRKRQGSRRGPDRAAKTIIYDRRVPERRFIGPGRWSRAGV